MRKQKNQTELTGTIRKFVNTPSLHKKNKNRTTRALYEPLHLEGTIRKYSLS